MQGRPIRKRRKGKDDPQPRAKRDDTTGIESSNRVDVLLESTIYAHSGFLFEKVTNTHLCIHSNGHIRADPRVYALHGKSAVNGAYSHVRVMETWRIDMTKGEV